jgi:RNA-directed DNA polymerase
VNLVERMARGVKLSAPKIFGTIMGADRLYRRILLPRLGREPRIIWQPTAELRLLQRWLVDNVLGALPVHESCHSYVRGRSIVTHVKSHAGTKYTSHIDIQNFFPSIRTNSVRNFLYSNAKLLGLEIREIDLIVAIVSKQGGLVIGAPSSPMLTNAIMYEFDTQANSIASAAGAIYTRYADDIYISSMVKDVAIPISDVLRERLQDMPGYNFFINERKTWHASIKDHREVTGIVLTSEGLVSLGREKKREIRSRVFHALHDAALAKTAKGKDELESLLGMLAYVRSVEPLFVLSLESKYGVDFLDRLKHRLIHGVLL